MVRLCLRLSVCLCLCVFGKLFCVSCNVCVAVCLSVCFFYPPLAALPTRILRASKAHRYHGCRATCKSSSDASAEKSKSVAPRAITLPPRSASCKQGEGRAGRRVLTTVPAPRERLVVDALLEELGHETGVPRKLAEPHALSGAEADVARVRGRDADVESAEGPLTSRGSQDVSRALARRGLKEAQHFRLGSRVRDHSGGQDDVAHFAVARSRRPGRTAQGVLVEAAARQLATRVALHGGQTTGPRRGGPSTHRRMSPAQREDRGLSSHIHSWDVVSSHRSAMRRASCQAVLGGEPLRQFGDAEVIDHGRARWPHPRGRRSCHEGSQARRAPLQRPRSQRPAPKAVRWVRGRDKHGGPRRCPTSAAAVVGAAAGLEGGWVAHEDSRRLGVIASTAHCPDCGGLVVERVEVLLEHGGAHEALAVVRKPNVERLRASSSWRGDTRGDASEQGPARHSTALAHASEATPPCSDPRWSLCFAQRSERSERPAGVHTGRCPSMAPRTPGRDAWNKALHGLVNAVVLQRRERIGEVHVHLHPHTHRLAERALGMDEDIRAVGNGHGALLTVEHGAPHTAQVPLKDPLAKNAPPDLADA